MKIEISCFEFLSFQLTLQPDPDFCAKIRNVTSIHQYECAHCHGTCLAVLISPRAHLELKNIICFRQEHL